MERCKGDFYVSLVRNLRFSRPNCTFSAWETYGSASGNVECGSRFVSLCRWILLFLCGDVNEEIGFISWRKGRRGLFYSLLPMPYKY